MFLTSRPSLDNDYYWLFELHRASYLDVITHQFGVWDEEEQLDMFLKVWHSENLTVLLNEGRPIGMYIIHNHVNYQWLAELQIAPKNQSKGFGSQVILTLLTNAQQLNKPIRLRVLFKNHRARKFYLRHGFTIINQTNYHHVMQASPV